MKARAKHGPISRRGYVRVVSGDDDPDRDLRIGAMEEAAARCLSGRSATIFEGRILNPLSGQPRRSFEDLAKQFNVSERRVQKILDRSKARVLAEARISDAVADGASCPRCGRVYAEWNFSQCTADEKRYLRPTWHVDLSPGPCTLILEDCLPQRLRADAAAMQRKYLYRGAGG